MASFNGFKWQVQYMACRDPDGNLISASSVDMLGDCTQERIPEEKVGLFLHALYIHPLDAFHYIL